MSKIEKLTKEQEALIPIIRQQWLDRLFKCDKKIDRKKATTSINWLYKFSNLERPMIIYVDSPMACQFAVHLLKKLFEEQKFFNQVGDQVGAQVGAQVWAQVGDQVGAQVGDQVWDQVGAQVWAQVWDQVGAQVWAQVGDQVWAQEIELQQFSNYGNIWDFGWLAFYEYFRSIGIKVEHEGFDKFSKLMKCGIYDMVQLKNFCIVSELPISITRDSENRLHNIKGSAIKWRDGYEQFYIHGRSMPEWIFKKFNDESLVKKDFIKEQNEDIKAGIYEIIESKGEGSMLNFLGAKEIDTATIIHSNGDLEELVLYKTKEKFAMEIDLNGKCPSPLAWLKMTCPSTGTNYLIPSDGSFLNCIDAAKYHRPNAVPAEVEYKWNQRN